MQLISKKLVSLSLLSLCAISSAIGQYTTEHYAAISNTDGLTCECNPPCDKAAFNKALTLAELLLMHSVDEEVFEYLLAEFKEKLNAIEGDERHFLVVKAIPAFSKKADDESLMLMVKTLTTLFPPEGRNTQSLLSICTREHASAQKLDTLLSKSLMALFWDKDTTPLSPKAFLKFLRKLRFFVPDAMEKFEALRAGKSITETVIDFGFSPEENSAFQSALNLAKLAEETPAMQSAYLEALEKVQAPLLKSILTVNYQQFTPNADFNSAIQILLAQEKADRTKVYEGSSRGLYDSVVYSLVKAMIDEQMFFDVDLFMEIGSTDFA